MNIDAVKYKIKWIRNRFYDNGDDDGVLMCDNLIDDLELGAIDCQESEEEEQE